MFAPCEISPYTFGAVVQILSSLDKLAWLELGDPQSERVDGYLINVPLLGTEFYFFLSDYVSI